MRAAREKLGHPIIDADAHVVECQFALEDTLKEAAGPRIAARFAEVLELMPVPAGFRL